MKKIISLSLLTLSSVQFLFSKDKGLKIDRPKIVVGIVLDQMRWDYLYRYYDRYSEGGFKRLLNKGVSCENAYIQYLPSYTAPGHASIYTGTSPAYHGIVANDWIENATGMAMYCVQDDGVKQVDTKNSKSKVGQKSPKNLLSTTIADELRLHTNFKSRTYGISIKDRGAILPVGHSANGAFWYDGNTGRFVSSTFYYQHLPQWANDFNNRQVSDSLLRIVWQTKYPINTYHQSTADNNAYEGKHKYESAPTFPHDFTPSLEKDFSKMAYSPYGNTIVRMLAEELIKHEELGQQNVTDFLAISFSTTDYVGHLYGVNAIEVEDMYYRIDDELSLFLNFLDKEYGQGNYVVFLTADHGGAHNVTFLNDNKIPAGFFDEKHVELELKSALKNQSINDSVILDVTNYQVYLNDSIIESQQIDRSKLNKIIKNVLLQNESVAYVLENQLLMTETLPIQLRDMLANSYYSGRSGQIQIVLKPAHYSTYGYTTGTTHGGWHPFDTHIPLLMYGWNIPQNKKIYRTISMTDIAPTIAALLKIQEPNASTGHVITEIFEN